jgi:hypothetical protein
VKDYAYKKGIDYMEQQIDDMITRGIQPEKLGIHHERDPCEGFPVVYFHRPKTESPHDVIRFQTGVDMNVLCHVPIIVIFDKVVIIYLPVWRQRYKDQDKINSDSARHVDSGILSHDFYLCTAH